MKHLSVILAISCVILFVGASFAYLYGPETKVSLKDSDSDSDVFEAKGILPADITYRVFSGTGVPEKIYLFADEKYSGEVISYRSQNKLFSAIQSQMERRGYTSTEIIDVKRLVEIVSDTANAPGKGIMFVSGALPEPVYLTDTNNMVDKWMRSGGTVYWSGPDMGKYRATEDGKSVETTGGTFYTAVGDGKEKHSATEATRIANIMGFTDSSATYGLKSGYPGSKVLGLYDEYSSLSVIPMDAGRIYVLGTYLDYMVMESIYAFTDIVICGITEDTVVKETGVHHKGYGTDTFTISGLTTGDLLFITVGSPVSVRGELFRF